MTSANSRFGKSTKIRLLKTVTVITLTAWICITLIPILIVVLTAFKSDAEISMANF